MDDLTYPQPRSLESLTAGLDVDNSRLLGIIIIIIIIIIITDLLHGVPAALYDHSQAEARHHHLDPLLALTAGPWAPGRRSRLKRTFIKMYFNHFLCQKPSLNNIIFKSKINVSV